MPRSFLADVKSDVACHRESAQSIAPDDKKVVEWLCRYAGQSHVALMYDCNVNSFDIHDDNLAAAERFAEMIDGCVLPHQQDMTGAQWKERNCTCK